MSLSSWREHPAAREEYLDAVAWHDDQEPGLGERLADRLDDAVDFIRQWADAAPPYGGRRRHPIVRSKRVDGFPYRVVYFVRDAEVVVVAYAHERRRPGYWRDRLGDA